MGSFFVVQREPCLETFSEVQTVFKFMQVEVLVFYGPPEPLDEDIVLEATSPVHADPNTVAFQGSGELLAGELTALIRVKDHRGSMAMYRLHQK